MNKHQSVAGALVFFATSDASVPAVSESRLALKRGRVVVSSCRRALVAAGHRDHGCSRDAPPPIERAFDTPANASTPPSIEKDAAAAAAPIDSDARVGTRPPA